MKYTLLTILISGLITTQVLASGDHDHDHDHAQEKDKQHKHQNIDDHSEHNHADHGSHDKHDDHEGHDHSAHAHGGSKAIGKGKAITKVDEKQGFQLSSQAIKNLKLKLKSVDGSTIVVPSEVVVKSKNKIGIYRFKDGFFKFLNAKVISNDKKTKKVKLHVAALGFGDQIVINGVALLRVSDVYSTDKSEYGHAH